MRLFIYFTAAFSLGAIPSAYLAGRFLKNIDIRKHGSGNVGATNAFRVLGKGPGIVVYFLDFSKGAFPVFLFSYFFADSSNADFLRMLSGLFSVLGHMFTPFLGFKGGKGIATGSGVFFAAYPVLFLAALACWTVSFWITKIVSISSLLAVSVLAFFGFWTVAEPSVKSLFAGMLVLVFWSHRSNIRRLIKGEEPGFSKTKK